MLAQEAPDGSSGPVPPSYYDGGVNRYLVTYTHSQTTTALRSATVVAVTNQSSRSCQVKIEWFFGLDPDMPACTTTAAVPPRFTFDFCSRNLPFDITACNSTCAPELTFYEGKAIVSSSEEASCGLIGVEARVYYTTGDRDTGVSAISNPKIVRADEGNLGD